ncbi:MAG TPA: fibronectin type III domain-containing protein [Kofleriaceae bacterium]|jgi:hypothetical protein|nr:fibronectin type III domain-containing protein [Kofleriaceae bacterium]
MRKAWLLVLALAPTASADPSECHIVNTQFTPIPNLQIVAWVEDTAGHFVDTAYITQAVGTYGLGNRPGRMDFNSGGPTHSTFPYGRRINTFPVWAHRHGLTFPEVDFQNGDEDALSHDKKQSSIEPHYCGPLLFGDQNWDVATCASVAYTDKGVMSSTKTSLYPPRQDITRVAPNDSESVEMYGAVNPFDAVSAATPPGNAPVVVSWVAPKGIALGSYVMWFEVAREFDYNDSYNALSYPSPDVPYGEFGEAYRGQPAVVYSVPFTIDESTSSADGTGFLGYSDPDGLDGNIRVPDPTITTAGDRFQLVSDNGMYRLRVVHTVKDDAIPPDAPTGVAAQDITPASATIAFTAPGDDGEIGTIAGYEIRYRAETPITADNFFDAGSNPVAAPAPGPPGSTQTVALDKLLPETNYSIGIRAHDQCHNTGPIVTLSFRTADRQSGYVDACFIATAAYGSKLASDVGMLRHFRDQALRASVLGELAIEAYYTFGPAVAGVIGESDLLRATTRSALAPVVSWVRTMAY